MGSSRRAAAFEPVVQTQQLVQAAGIRSADRLDLRLVESEPSNEEAPLVRLELAVEELEHGIVTQVCEGRGDALQQ